MLLSDSADPSWKKSRTLKFEPHCVMPYMLTALPKRDRDRKLIVLPTETASSIESELPNRTMP
jgi:hypothetical protein